MKFVLVSNYSKIEVGVTIRKLKNTDNSQKMEISSLQNYYNRSLRKINFNYLFDYQVKNY